MEGRIRVSSAMLLLMFLLSALMANGVRGDACSDKSSDCVYQVTSAAVRVTDLFHDDPVNVTAIVSKCQGVQQLLTICEEDLRAVCPANSSVDDKLQSLQSTYNSACGLDTLCQFRLLECSLSSSDVNEISGLMGQRPPKVQMAKEKCSAVNRTRTPCMEKLKTDCGGVSSVASSIPSYESAFASLCGKEPMCQAQLFTCTSLLPRGDAYQMCSAVPSVHDCFANMDAECQTMPDIQQAISGLTSSFSYCSDSSGGSEIRCPQLYKCMNNPSANYSQQCSWSGSLVSCVVGLKNTCSLKEDYISFQEVGDRFQQFCQEITKAGSGGDCEMVGDCVLGSDLMRKVSSPSTSMQDRESLLLDSETWCSYLEIAAECYVKSNSSCQTNPSLLSYMTSQLGHLKTACHSSAQGVGIVLWNSALIVLLAVLTSWTPSFL